MGRKNKFNELEIQLASSILYYDDKEMKRFFDVYDSISSDINIAIDGMFDLFVSYIRHFKHFCDDVEERKSKLIDEINIRNENCSNADTRENFELWFSKVLEKEVPMELADDILNHFVWEEYKKAINQVDSMDIPYIEKLAIRPKTPKSLKKKGLIRLSDIDEDDGDYDNATHFTTGLTELDKIVEFSETEFVVIAARPGVGKSLLMLRQAMANSEKGIKTLYVSFEMNSVDLDNRIINYVNRENLKEQYKDEYGILDYKGYKEARKLVKQNKEYKTINENLYLYESETSSADAILTEIEDQIKNNNFKAVFIDYLQLLRFNRMDEWASLRALTNALKNLAFRTNTLIVTGSQVSRSSTEHGLYLSDLFGSSSIESDTDTVIGLENFKDRKQGQKALLNIKVMKNRKGDLAELKYIVDYSNSILTYNEE